MCGGNVLSPASASAPRFDLLLQHCDSVFVVVERSTAGKLLFVSESAHRVLGVDPDILITCATPAPPSAMRSEGLTWVSTPRHDFVSLFPDDRGAARALLAAVLTSTADAPPAVAHLRMPKVESGRCSRTFLEAKVSSDGEYLYCALRDVTEVRLHPPRDTRRRVLTFSPRAR